MAWLKIFIFLIVQYSMCYYANSQDAEHYEIESVQYIKKRGYSVEACYRMAEDFLKSSAEQGKAIPYLEYIIESDKEAGPQVFYMLAQSYYFSGQFDLAIKVLTEYIKLEKNGKLKKQAKKELEKFENAQQMSANPLNVQLVNLGPKINSKYAEINPFVSIFENLLVFSSKRGRNFNIYVSKKKQYEPFWNKSKLAGSYINTVNDEFVAGLSPSGRNLFVHYNQFSGFEDINISKRTRGLYRELENPGTKINSSYREEGACMSKEKDTLYFASDRPGGLGGFDIYYSLKLPEGDWGPPINMGNKINTRFNENYPNLSPDGSKLYFASQGHNSIGGFDIFYTTFNSVSRAWREPVNIGYPINNAYDNKNIAFTENERYAYISTVDMKTFGDFDIYKVIFLDVEPHYLIIKAEVFVKDSIENKPFKFEQENLVITVYKGEETYGIYSFDKRNNSFVLALIPGVYTLHVESEKYSSYKRQITINENYYKNKHRALRIFLEKKLN